MHSCVIRHILIILLALLRRPTSLLLCEPHFYDWDRPVKHYRSTLASPQVQSGAGRTGRWWGHEHWMDSSQREASPDLLVFAKGIASGYPFAGVAGSKALFDPKKMPPGTLVRGA